MKACISKIESQSLAVGQKSEIVKENANVNERKNSSRDNESLVKYRIRITGVPEAPSDVKFSERQNTERESVINLLNFINVKNCSMTDCFRLGKFNPENKHPRTLLVTFSSVWDRSKILQSCSLLKNYKYTVFVSPELSSKDKIVHKAILKKRWQLIQSGTDRNQLKIRNLKLFKDNVEVDIESD